MTCASLIRAIVVSDNPDQPTVEHFQLLRRQWSSKAHMLIATLRELHDANSNAVKCKLIMSTSSSLLSS